MHYLGNMSRAVFFFPRARAIAYNTIQRCETRVLRRFCVAVNNQLEKSEQSTEVRHFEDKTFPELFKRSKFVTAYNPVGKKVEGVVLAVVDDNLYVDFGCKFHAVVPVPSQKLSSYRRNTRVIVRILDLEMTDHFIGDGTDLTLLEAEAELVGLAD